MSRAAATSTRAGAERSAPPSNGAPRTMVAPLLYWLLVVSGLAGITLLRASELGELVPLWIGAIGGVAIGQLSAFLRVRLWILAAMAMAAFWFAPIFFFLTFTVMGTSVSSGAIVFLPALACGYLSLSERGGLVAFWFPAMLWMLVILDGPTPGMLDTRAALPFFVGLGAMFVAFLRARETRRVALWQTCAVNRLAVSAPRSVFRSSPIRAASQHVWTVVATASALVLAAWIAPHLWQKERAKHAADVASAVASAAGTSGAVSVSSAGSDFYDDGRPCCSDDEGSRVRVRELLPLVHGRDEASTRSACADCRRRRVEAAVSAATWGTSGASYGTTGTWYETGGASYGTGPATAGTGASLGTPPSTHLGTTDGTGLGGAASGSTTPSTASGWAGDKAALPALAPHAPGAAAAPLTTTLAATTAPPSSSTVVAKPAAAGTPPHVPVGAEKTGAAHAATMSRPLRASPVVAAADARLTSTTAPLPDASAPWRSMLALCLSALALHVVWRALRRLLRLRHLQRPFWRETLDQRISNQWERMLIGLRDAGIAPAAGEQPNAFARRVGIAGMERCAKILERVRHGVRVDEGDLDAMCAAAGDVYRSARERAGLAARTAAWVRWPLA